MFRVIREDIRVFIMYKAFELEYVKRLILLNFYTKTAGAPL
jgi:hypothetical protein